MNLQRSHWAVYFIFWLLATVGGGALVGAVGFALLGPLFSSDHSIVTRALAGARHVGFIAFIWAPAIALVATVRRTYLNRASRQ